MKLRTRTGFVVICLAACSTLAACGPQGPEREGDPALDARVAVSPTPAQAGPARIRIRVTDGGEPLADARVRLVVRSPAGDSVGPVSAEPSPAGYGPVTVVLRRAGSWQVEVRVTAPDGRTAVLRHPLQVVGEAGG